MNIPYGPILVVEDNPNVRELLEVTLHFKGYQVVSVENGQAALEFIAREHPALIVTDKINNVWGSRSDQSGPISGYQTHVFSGRDVSKNHRQTIRNITKYSPTLL